MQETEITGTPIGKVYTAKQVYVGAALGGPIVAGYLFLINYRYFGKEQKAKNALVISIAFTIALFIGFFLLPETVNVPNYIIPIIYAAIASGIFNAELSPLVDEHIRKRGETFSWGNVVLVSLFGLAGTLVLIFAIAFLGII